MTSISFTPGERQSFTEQWAVIKQLTHWSRTWVTGGGTAVTEMPADAFFNLPVVLAFSLLDEVLTTIGDKGAFSTTGMLGTKMQASKSVLPWSDFSAVNAAKDQRNNLAHEGKLIPKAECQRVVELIGDELRAFGAISV